MLAKLLLLVQLALLATSLSLIQAAGPFNLIHPFIDRVNDTTLEGCRLEGACSFEIDTKAGKFKLSNLAMDAGDSGSIERRLGTLPEDTVADLELYSDAVIGSSTALLYCHVRNQFEFLGMKYELCLDETRLVIRSAVTGYQLGMSLLQYNDVSLALPIASSYAWVNGDDFYLFTFDMGGNIIGSLWQLVAVKKEAGEALGFRLVNKYRVAKRQLSTVPYPLGSVDPWLKTKDTLKQEISEKLKVNMNDKFRAAFITAITPMYLDFDKAPAASTKSVALCVHRGQNMDFYCQHNGVDQSAFVDRITRSNVDSRFISHAFHLMNHKQKRYTHYIYSIATPNLTSNGSTMYLFCQREGELAPNKNVDQSSPIVMEVDRAPTGCQRYAYMDWDAIPADIIGFSDGRCKKTIALYKNHYVVGEPDTLVPKISPQIAKQMPEFLTSKLGYIQAAMAIGRKIYFFTRSNNLTTIMANMTNDCQELQFDVATMKEMLAQPFVWSMAWQKSDGPPMAKPYLIDYRYYAKGSNDTIPPLDYEMPNQETFLGAPLAPTTPRPATNTTKAPDSSITTTIGSVLIPSTSPTPDTDPVPSLKPANNTSGIVMIVIGSILAGLILASIIYMFCFRSDPPAEPRSRRANAAAGLHKTKSLVAPTMRSSLSADMTPKTASKMASTATTMIPPNKSRAGSPKSRSKRSPVSPNKSHKSEHKSKRSPGSSKKSSIKSPKSVLLKSPKSPKSVKSAKSLK